jgi:hypothetical protein
VTSMLLFGDDKYDLFAAVDEGLMRSDVFLFH